MPNDTMNFGVDLLPITTNAYNLGSADKKWNIFGNLTGKLNVITHTNTTNGNKTYYPWFGTSTSGNLNAKAHNALYLYETVTNNAISKYDLCVGAAAIKGSITLYDGNGNYCNIRPINSNLGSTKAYDLPAESGTIALLTKTDINALINLLDTGSSDLTANDYVITQYVGGGTTTTTYHRRPASKVVNAGLVKAALGTDSSTTNQWLNKSGTWSTPTATNIGLGNVENTALSTWAGTSNITTVGTITTGTWNGDTIAIANGGTGGTTAIAARANLGIGNGKVFYGTCTSTASATTKQVECDEFDPETDFNEGTMVSVHFTVKNTGAVGSLKLSVGNVIKGYTTAAAIKKIYATSGVSNLTNAAEIPAGGVVTFVYSGTYWQVVGLDYNTNTNNAVTQSIASSTELQYPILLSYYTVGSTTTTANSVYRNNSIYAIPGKGELYATSFHGTLVGNTDWTNINNRPIGGTTAYLNENNATGYVKVKINAKQQWMMAFTLRIHQNYKIRDFHINGYNYGTRHWYSQKVSCLINDGSTSIPNVIFGYDDDAENNYNTLWVAIPSEAYEGAEIVNAVSHWGLEDATSKFEIIYESTLTGITQATQTPFTYVNGKQGMCYGAYSGDPANFHLRSGLTIREADLAGATQSNLACAPRLSFYWDGYGVATHLTMYNNGEMYLNKLDGSNVTQGNFHASKVYGAVWNDYAEYRTTNENVKPGQVVIDNDDGSLSITEDYLLPGAQVVSDTYGFAIGETETAKTPLAVSGRVLVYTYKNREEYHAGQAVCSAPGGTVITMTREEIQKYPDAIIGIVSEIPDYETWGSDNILVDNRIWIKVR